MVTTAETLDDDAETADEAYESIFPAFLASLQQHTDEPVETVADPFAQSEPLRAEVRQSSNF
jgi:hypothetical protein